MKYLLLAFLSLSTAALGQGLYAGGSLGATSADIDCQGVQCDRSDKGGRLFGGYALGKNLAVEVGYAELGRATVNGDGVRGRAADLVGVFTYPVAYGVSGVGKLGAYRSRSYTSDVKESHSGATLGLGLQYDLSKSVAARAEWQRYNNLGGDEVGGRADVDSVSVGLLVRF